MNTLSRVTGSGKSSVMFMTADLIYFSPQHYVREYTITFYCQNQPSLSGIAAFAGCLSKAQWQAIRACTRGIH